MIAELARHRLTPPGFARVNGQALAAIRADADGELRDAAG